MTEDETKSIERLPGEHFLIYLDRLLKMKENKDVDIEKTEIYSLVFGLEISTTEARKRLTLYRDLKNQAEEEGQDLQAVIADIDTIVPGANQVKPQGENKCLTEEEDRTQVIDMGEKFHIYNSKRSIVIDKAKVKSIKEAYCDEHPLTINELCRKLNIPRRDFMLLKNGFNITHDDIPYLEEDIHDDNIQDLVDATLEKRKEKYFIKLQQEEVRQMKGELEKYRKQDYLFDKISSSINDIKIEPVKYSVEISKKPQVREALLDCMDQHLGLKSDNHWNKYSVAEAEKRFETLTKETIEFCAEEGVTILHVSSLGDFICGLIHTSLRLESEIDVVAQIKLATTLMGKMLKEFALVFDKVIYTDVAGNHGRMMPQKSESLDGENFEYLISFSLGLMLQNEEKIVFEDNFYDEGIIVKHIAGVTIIEAHGDSDKLAKAATTLPLMTESPGEIHLGHEHSNKSIEQNCIEVFVGRSFSGTDSYAKNLRLTSKAGQKLFVYSEGKRIFIHDIVFN